MSTSYPDRLVQAAVDWYCITKDVKLTDDERRDLELVLSQVPRSAPGPTFNQRSYYVYGGSGMRQSLHPVADSLAEWEICLLAERYPHLIYFQAEQ